jgi:exodeoxyribonuclease X
MTFIRVIDLETAGNGLQDVCEIGWQDVELGPDMRWYVGESRGSLLVNPGRPISPETMAVHHILDRQVENAPFWGQLAEEFCDRRGIRWRWQLTGRVSSSVTAHQD